MSRMIWMNGSKSMTTSANPKKINGNEIEKE
jgi:hypothetical protein